jgi:1-deoxy-D-xylulose-5-phosphate reductoisomerase
MKKISIIGATGSIGTQTLDVLRSQKDSFKLMGISANTNSEKTIEIIKEFCPKLAVLTDKTAYEIVREKCKSEGLDIDIQYGMNGLINLAKLPESQILVTSVVGMTGLIPTINAIRAGKDIALANKETLVAAGEIVIREANAHNVKILPVDSEHGAIFQCLQGNENNAIHKILLTASGGPFRGKTKKELMDVTVNQALKHPKWNMGKKISIDSATLMNKGLEVIEAYWLFKVKPQNIEVVIHPQSVVHSMVEYEDGSVLAQLASTDMRLPIQYALNYPKRVKRVVPQLDLFKIGELSFEKPDMNTFIPLKLAYSCLENGGLSCAILNAANEAAVELFLKNNISFLKIGDILEECLNKFDSNIQNTIENILEIDTKVKQFVIKKYRNN